MEHIVKKQVAEFREENKLKKYAPIEPYDLLEKLGIVTLFLPCNPTISGMAIKTGTNRFMMINSSLPLGRQHFTIFHELYHLYIQEEFISLSCLAGNFNKKDKHEYAADLFAAFLMMPEETVYANISEEELESKQIELETIIKLEQKLKCSHQALLFRLRSLNIITQQQYNEKKEEQGITKKTLALGYDDSLYKPGNDHRIIGDYEKLAQKIYEDDKISESHYTSLMQDIFKEL